jgi:pyridoxal phosphate enzyme (YggS family)
MHLREDIKEFLETIPNNVTIVAATKYVSDIEMRDLYNANITNFGENRVEAFLDKYEKLKDINPTWHFIGHLQRNKAKKIINKIDYLHSLDSIELAKIINKEREKPLNCFIEVSIKLEESKDGVPYMEFDDFMNQVLQFDKVKIVGFMMMAIKGDSIEDLKNQFERLRDLRDLVSKKYKIDIPYLSMGMSDDYKEAIEASATHIRLGRILWKD